ncbi:schwannomin-interacting protein 1 [Nelusetta ayraudi]|uniref:schwannomin-interacting protein 1 n=1 Tax=Nelusetta ayraudi TaxID=303726 RepID=UPI003F715701
MEGEKERQREEKESNEAEDEVRSDDNTEEEEEEEEEEEKSSEVAALLWQEGYGEDGLNLPIMHWEALSLRIAELEKQEEEKKEKRMKSGLCVERGRAAESSAEESGRRAQSWEDGDDACNSHVMALTSRLQTQMNLQLCFINNSESEEEEEEEEKKGGESSKKENGSTQVQKEPQAAEKPQRAKFRGFRNTLKSIRDKLRTDKNLAAAGHSPVQRRHLERRDLQSFSLKDLTAHSKSLSQAIQDLSTELVTRLQVRDQLRTEQDAMLLEVQDLTSL